MKAALLLVDLQTDYLAAAGLQPSAAELTAKAAALLNNCRAQKIPAIHIWTSVNRADDRRLPHWKKKNLWQCVEGTAGHRPPAPLRPLKSETVIHKNGFNGFAGGGLDAALQCLKCDTVIVAGIHLHTCVRAVVVESLERGLHVFVGEDAVAANDPILAAATRRWLVERGVEFISSKEIKSRLDGAAPSKLSHRSPRETKKVLFTVPVAGAGEIAKATRSAQAAGKHWRQGEVKTRCEILERAARRLEAAAPALAKQMAVEIGKPVSHGLEEIRRAAANILDVTARAAVFEFEKRQASGLVRHEPLGVVALISPWNNPVAIPVGKIAPALVYGNTVVWKPAPAATPISKFILKILRAAGIPAGAIQLLTGDHTTAQKLAADKNISAVTITSSAQAGYAIQEICARRFLPLQAELSGNNAAIVWEDADLKQAAAAIAGGAFGFAGQRCTANRRVIVPEKIYSRFWRELKIAAEKLNWGDPLDKATDIGPVIHAGKAAEHTALLATARQAGVVRRSEPLFQTRAGQPWAKCGAYVQPVIIACDEPGHALVQEETMSPLLIVQCAKDFTHALDLLNGVRHGLVAALYTNLPGLQKRFLAEAEAGMLKLNSSTAGADVSLPFGGWKMSGLGPPEHGVGDVLFYTRLQAVYGAQPKLKG
ncbi:MAG TPA: aldehyde dehydrogenase family protein [Verrucomicrobiae bacterium]|nr:aldehyde dehydrogenase family protein [Verrucomicrobiae bacterium]